MASDLTNLFWRTARVRAELRWQADNYFTAHGGRICWGQGSRCLMLWGIQPGACFTWKVVSASQVCSFYRPASP